MLLNWADDADIDNPGAVMAALEGLVPDPAAILLAAEGEETKAALRAQTAAARTRGIFGAPTFIVRDEMFWGDDRLEDALEYATGLGREEP